MLKYSIAYFELDEFCEVSFVLLTEFFFANRVLFEVFKRFSYRLGIFGAIDIETDRCRRFMSREVD